MNTQFIRLLMPLWLSGVLLLTLAVTPPPKHSWPGPLPSVQSETDTLQPTTATHSAEMAHSLSAVTVDHLGKPLASQAEWSDICVNRRMEISGLGMGDTDHPINPQTVSLSNPAGVNWLLAQGTGRYSDGASTPDSVIFTTSVPESLTLNQPTNNTSTGYTFEANLQPTGQITAFVNNPGGSYKTPRGLILYAKQATTETWTSVGKTTNIFVFHNSYMETLTFPPLTQTTDLFITAVVIDNQEDSRPLVLEARAGDRITQSLPITGPTDGPLLNIVPLTLTQVPTGTSSVSLTLVSPVNNGDSLVWVGVNVSYRCPGSPPPVEANLAVTKTVNTLTPDPGDIITFTVVVTNNGPDNATGVWISDTLPGGVTFVSSSTTTNTSYTPPHGLWEVGDLAKGAIASLTITARVNDCTNGRTITNTAKILAVDQIDSNLDNNEAGVEINVSTVTPCYIYLPIIYKNYERPICTPYSDNFNNSTSGWETGNYSNVQFDYSISPGDSKYFIHNRREGLQIVQAPIMPTNKFSVSVDAYSDTSIGVGQYGLTFGQATNVANIPAYRFLIDPITKQYQLEYGNNAIGWDCVNAPAPCWVTPPPTTTIYIGSMSQPNHLGVECDSTSVKLHINNQLVWQGILTSTPRCFGYVGIVSRATSDNDVKAYFDNFEVSCPFGISSP